MIKRSVYLFGPLVITILAFLITPLLKASCEASELTEELQCDHDSILKYYDLFVNNTPENSIVHNTHNTVAPLEFIISYLAKYEKSPPK